MEAFPPTIGFSHVQDLEPARFPSASSADPGPWDRRLLVVKEFFSGYQQSKLSSEIVGRTPAYRKGGSGESLLVPNQRLRICQS